MIEYIAAAQVQCDKLKIGTAAGCDTGLPTVSADSSLQIILQLVFGVLASVAVLVIIISAIRFNLSQGDPQKVSKARSTIIFALVGLVIALSAEAIVTFVLGNI